MTIGNELTYCSFIEKIKLTLRYTHHFSILYTSPSKMKHKLKSTCHCKELSGPSELGHIRRARFRCSRAAFVQINHDELDFELMQTSSNFRLKKEEFTYLILPLLEKVLGLSETNDNLQCTM